MENEFIPYEQALALKELGFDKKCFKGWYNQKDIESTVSNPVDFNNKNDSENFVSQPTFSQCFRWFREKYDLHYVIVKAESWFYTINGCNTQEGFNTYEEAELECLVKLIDIIKKQNLKG